MWVSPERKKEPETKQRRILKINKQMLEANEMKLLRKIVGKTKIDKIRSQQIKESCGIQPINQWAERRREWDQHVTRMDAEKLVKISRDNIPVGRRSQDALTEDGAT